MPQTLNLIPGQMAKLNNPTQVDASGNPISPQDPSYTGGFALSIVDSSVATAQQQGDGRSYIITAGNPGTTTANSSWANANPTVPALPNVIDIVVAEAVAPVGFTWDITVN